MGIGDLLVPCAIFVLSLEKIEGLELTDTARMEEISLSPLFIEIRDYG